MKKSLKFASIAVCAFVVGLSVNNFAVSNVPANYKVAVVDVQKVVSSSAQVNALKEEQRKKITDLTNFVEKARADIAKESDATKKKALEDKANSDLNVKREKIEKEYAAKLASIDKSITGVITTQAKAANYDLVLAKGIVLYGGTDITANVQKNVK